LHSLRIRFILCSLLHSRVRFFFFVRAFYSYRLPFIACLRFFSISASFQLVIAFDCLLRSTCLHVSNFVTTCLREGFKNSNSPQLGCSASGDVDGLARAQASNDREGLLRNSELIESD